MSEKRSQKERVIRQIMVSLYPRHYEIIKRYQEEHGILTISDTVRRILDEYVELKEHYEKVNKEIEDLKQESRQLREMLRDLMKRRGVMYE